MAHILDLGESVKPLFSGHDTFPLRYGWLKKAYDAVSGQVPSAKGSVFRDKEAIATFGVGKNMVGSIRHWAKCSGVIAEDARTGQLATTEFGDFLFGLKGFDRYLERPASLWLIHWTLCTLDTSRPTKTTWYWVFNHLGRSSLTRTDLTNELLKLAHSMEWTRVSPTTARRDVECFLRTYEAKLGSDAASVEAGLESMLAELGLIRSQDSHHQLVRGPKSTLSNGVFAYALNQFWRKHEAASSMSFEKVAFEPGSPGRVFLLDETDLAERVLALERTTEGVFHWSETAGLRQVYRHHLVDESTALGWVASDVDARSRRATS